MKHVIITMTFVIFLLGCTGTRTIDQMEVTNNNVPEPLPNQEQVVMLKITGMT